MSYDMPESMESYEKKEEKRRKVLRKRLKALPKNNKIVKEALKKKASIETRNEKHEKWEVVDSLISTAYGEYFDGDMSFKDTVKSLSEALEALV